MCRDLTDPHKQTVTSRLRVHGRDGAWNGNARAAMLTMQSVTLMHWHNKPQTYLTRLALLHCTDELRPLLLGYSFCCAGSLGAEQPDGPRASAGKSTPALFVPYFICSSKREEIGHGGNYCIVIVAPQSITLFTFLTANWRNFPTPAYLNISKK